MTDKLAKLLQRQISLTEWLRDINGAEAVEMYEEDNHKRERLAVLASIIGLPFDKPTQFEALAVKERTPEVTTFLDEHNDELCQLSLIAKPGHAHLPKLRMRGLTVEKAMQWFDEQRVQHDQYLVNFVPHADDHAWATIFVVNQQGIFGEAYYGGHHVLTQGFHEGRAPLTFAFDFKNWSLTPHDDDALAYLKQLIKMIHVTDEAQKKEVAKKLDGTFAHDYLEGYFESTHSQSLGTWFIDYNRVLGRQYSDFVVAKDMDQTSPRLVSGRVASAGEATGRVAIVLSTQEQAFARGDILVCPMTSPDYLPLMKKAAAIVTDQGGILCHAAIVARELKKPCIVGTGNATQVLKNGQRVTVNATKGIVS